MVNRRSHCTQTWVAGEVNEQGLRAAGTHARGHATFVAPQMAEPHSAHCTSRSTRSRKTTEGICEEDKARHEFNIKGHVKTNKQTPNNNGLAFPLLETEIM